MVVLVSTFADMAVGVLVESESLSLFFSQVAQVEDHSNQVTLSIIVVFIRVVINNAFLSVSSVGREVLEVVQIQGVSQDVVSVDSLQVALAHDSGLQSVQALVSQDFHVHHISAVLFFLD